MSLLKLSLSHLIAVLACTWPVATVRAELVKRSPFLPPHADEVAAPQTNGLEYMGWVGSTDGKRFRVVDPAKKSGAFLKVGEADSTLDVALKQYGEEPDTITIDHGSQTVTLPSRKSKVSPAGALMPATGTPAAMLAPDPRLRSSAGNLTGAGTPQLDAIVAEVAKRRALRDQALKSPPGGAPSPATAGAGSTR